MRGCHNCKHAAAIAGLKYAKSAWEDTPCAGCPEFRYERVIGHDDNEGGDDGAVPGGDAEVEADEPTIGTDDEAADAVVESDGGGVLDAVQGPRDEDGDEPVMPAWVLVVLARLLMKLRPRLRDAVCLRCQGWSFAEIARELNVSEDAAERRVARAVELWPVLAWALPGKSGQTARGDEGDEQSAILEEQARLGR